MPPRRFTDEQEIAIVDTYLSGVSAREVSERMKCSPNTIQYILHKRGVDTSTQYFRRNLHPFSVHAFDCIDNEQSAYWLGFIAADGHVQNVPSRFTVNLQVRDANHLEQMRTFLKMEAPLSHYTNKEGYSRCTLRVSKPHFTDRLSQMGIVKGKPDLSIPASFTPPEYLNHFVRGFFDGDGNAQKIEHRIQFVGARLSMTWLQSTLAELIGTNPNGKLQRCANTEKVVTLNYTGHNQVGNITDWLYRDATVFMERKREIIRGYT